MLDARESRPTRHYGPDELDTSGSSVRRPANGRYSVAAASHVAHQFRRCTPQFGVSRQLPVPRSECSLSHTDHERNRELKDFPRKRPLWVSKEFTRSKPQQAVTTCASQYLDVPTGENPTPLHSLVSKARIERGEAPEKVVFSAIVGQGAGKAARRRSHRSGSRYDTLAASVQQRMVDMRPYLATPRFVLLAT